MIRWLPLLSCVIGCTEPDPVASVVQPVTAGSADPGDPAVVALVLADGSTLCTATLVEAHTLVTAAHCLAGRDPRTLQAELGPSVGTTATTVAIAAGSADPAFDLTTLAHDVALITLRGEVPTAPLAIDPRTLDSSLVGATFEVVGYGVTASGSADSGDKRAGTAQVESLSADELTTVPMPSQPCNGDSGGPALFTVAGTTYVTGVVSRGDAACRDHAIYERLDAVHASFIAPYLAATGPASAATGDACLNDAQCAHGPCLQTADDPSLYFCSQPCTQPTDCPAAMACAADGCRYPTPSPGALGSTCGSDGTCTSGLCYLGGDRSACTTSCLVATCPTGFDCVAVDDLDNDCLPHVSASSGGGCDAGDPDSLPLTALGLVLVGLRRRRA